VVNASPASRRKIASPLLMWCQFARPAHVHTRWPLARTLPSLVRARINSFFRNSASPPQDGEHQPAMSRCRVRPYISQRLEAGATLGDLIQGVEQGHAVDRANRSSRVNHKARPPSAKPVHDLCAARRGSVFAPLALLAVKPWHSQPHGAQRPVAAKVLPVSRNPSHSHRWSWVCSLLLCISFAHNNASKISVN